MYAGYCGTKEGYFGVPSPSEVAAGHTWGADLARRLGPGPGAVTDPGHVRNTSRGKREIAAWPAADASVARVGKSKDVRR